MPIVVIFTIVIGTFSLSPSRESIPLFDLIAVFLVLPAVVWLAMCNEPTRGARVLSLLGTISYPLYMLHSSLFRVLRKALERTIGPDYLLYAPWIGIALIGTLIAVSWAADHWYDRPIRKWLAKLIEKKVSP
jgi:peptidoglycan/LPS O-acetylase OafA/YrhL